VELVELVELESAVVDEGGLAGVNVGGTGFGAMYTSDVCQLRGICEL